MLYRCFGENRWAGSDQLPVDHRDHSLVPSDHGVWQWALQNGILSWLFSLPVFPVALYPETFRLILYKWITCGKLCRLLSYFFLFYPQCVLSFFGLSEHYFETTDKRYWWHCHRKREKNWKGCGIIVFQVATFILQKILLDDTGLAYICQTYERFSHVAMILVSHYLNYFYVIQYIYIQLISLVLHSSSFQGKMVLQLSKEPSARLLKHVVRCYLRLSDNSRYFLLWISLKFFLFLKLLKHNAAHKQNKTAGKETSKGSSHRTAERLSNTL